MKKIKQENRTKESDKAKYLLIWDSNSKYEMLQAKPVNNENEFNKVKEKLFTFKAIFILAELTWSSHLRSEFYGFQIARQLRLEKKLTCPIIFCSFMENFDRKDFPDSKILGRPGHYFLRLPDQKPDFESYAGIDEATLDDINIDLNDPQSELHTLMHNTLNKIPELLNENSTKNEAEEEVIKFLNNSLETFKIRGNIQHENFREFDELKKNIFSDINEIFRKSYFQADLLKEPLKDYRHLIYKLLPKNISNVQPQKVTKKRWKVLFIDDQQDTCTKVENHFLRNGINCVSANNANKAFKLLSEDEKTERRISVVITDFRFYICEAEKDVWQDYQGYRILSEIHNKFTYNYAYVILTSKEGTIKEQIKKRSKFQIIWFNKNDVLDGNNSSFNIFCQTIIEVGDVAFLRKHSLPSYGGWVSKVGDKVTKEFNYRSLYKLHVEDSENYDKAEFQINSRAIELSELNEMPDGYTLEPSFKNFHNNKRKLLNRFRDTILLYRRIFVILKYKKYKTNKEIFTFFKPQYSPSGVLKNNTHKKTKSKARADLNLSEDEIKERQRFEAQNSLFHSNWGFSKKNKSTELNFNIPENIILDEEKKCLKYLEVNTNDFNNHDDGFILMEFLHKIKKLNWQNNTKELIVSLEQRLGLEDQTINWNEIESLFSLFKNEFRNSQDLKHLYKNEVNEFLEDNESESSIIFDFIK
jgi:hypothetical protein